MSTKMFADEATTSKSISTGSIQLFTTCPPYRGVDRDAYIKNVRDVSRWSEEAGCKGMLVYTDNGLVDPWLVSQIVIQNTATLSPLVAVQPVYMHPYTVAKMVSTLSYLYNRRLSLNFVAGGFKGDLLALNDTTPHDKRYDRLIEYATILQHLLAHSSPVTFEGEFYRVEQLSLRPALPKELFPLITISGSSEAGLMAAQALNAIPVMYPEPSEKCIVPPQYRNGGCGMRVGIIARKSEEDSWRIAEERFPLDRAGQLTHDLALKVSDSVWHHALSNTVQNLNGERNTYWLRPFRTYHTFCPYLVGSYADVADELCRYLSAGYGNFILDVPASEEELGHIARVFELAQQRSDK